MGRNRTASFLQKALITTLTLWFGFHVVAELSTRSKLRERSQRGMAAPQRWQLGSPQERQLRSLLDLAGGEIPQGSYVGLVAPASMTPNRVFFLERWAGYLAPSLHIHSIKPANPAGVEYCLAFRRRLGRSHFQLLAESPVGAVYRVVP
ncbi:MAG: hypothetical protein K0U98_16260 [Deltaproteobacteria bacterium]|nr:hypothetical protein [Deltaproteobacteria bacterium]